MKPGKFVVSLGLIGMLTGGYFGGVYFHGGVWAAVFGASAGAAALGGVLGRYYHQASVEVKQRIKFGVTGLVLGALVGGGQIRNMGYTGVLCYIGLVVGAIVGTGFFALPVAGFINRQKAKQRYLSYTGEILWIFGTGVLGILLSQYITFIVNNGTIRLPLPAHWVIGIYGILFAFILSLLFTIPLGFILAANHTRPVLGAVVAMTGGLLVLWIGINLAPILFVPHSGLYWSGLIIGLSMLTAGILVVFYPRLHVLLGAVTIVLSILSLVGAAGGLIIGSILGIFGGALIVGWNGIPAAQPQKKNPQQPGAAVIEN